MKQSAPSAERNRDPILAQLRELLPARGLVLEVASGTGQHAIHFAAALPGIEWQPTDVDEAYLASQAAWIAEAGLENVRAPLTLDTTAPWPVARADAIYCANMIHISPWEAGVALLEGAGRVLPAGGPLVLYGPYAFDGVLRPESNVRFDAWLKAKDPRFGVRDLREVTRVAEGAGLRLERVVEMPANNHIVVFRRA